jgi:hypothetical protein
VETRARRRSEYFLRAPSAWCQSNQADVGRISEIPPESLPLSAPKERACQLSARCPLLGVKRTSCGLLTMSASLIGRFGSSAFRLSTVAVSMSLTGSRFSSESALGPFQHGDSRTRRTNLLGGLAVRRTAGPSGHAISPHPSSREGHHSTARWSSRVLLSNLILHLHAAAASFRVQRNSLPSTQMRCMITASRRAKATIAFFNPRRLAICIAQALSQDHFVARTSRIWAAS